MRTKNIYEEDRDKEIMDVFRKVAVNIPLLDVIKQVLKYSIFLKDFRTHKRRLKLNERFNMGRNVSTLIQPTLVSEKVTTEQHVSTLT